MSALYDTVFADVMHPGVSSPCKRIRVHKVFISITSSAEIENDVTSTTSSSRSVLDDCSCAQSLWFQDAARLAHQSG